ncbi:reverse transcriptase domain-containing protein [Tanacetum coccineum]
MICGLFKQSFKTSGTLPSNTIPNPKGEMKAITTRSGIDYEGPSIPTNLSPKKIVERETEKTTDEEQTNFQGSTAQIPPPVILFYLNLMFRRTLLKPFPFRSDIPKNLRFDISFADALLLMPRFAPTIKSLLMNKEKLLELAKIPLNENCLVMFLKKLPEKLGDPGKFLIPCNFPGIEDSPRCFCQVGKFHFPTNFVVVDFEADPRVPLILGRSFLRTGRALIDVYGEEITLRVDSEAVTFNLESKPRDISSKTNQIEAYLKDDCNPEEDICLIEKLLNNDPFQLPPMDLKQSEVTEAKSSIEEPPELELKDLSSHLEYAFLEENDKLPPWVSPVHCVPKKGGITVVANEENELISTRLVTRWRVCIDYRKLNEATRKDHFPLPFMDQMIERLAGNEFYCFLDGFSGYFQIPIDPQDQEKTTFTCPYGTFAYRRMPFGLCNAPGTFQRCMMAIFHDMIEKTMEVFMDDFSVFGDSFDSCLSNLEKMLKRCEDTNLVLNWEKCHFMCKEGIVLGHKISKAGIEVDHAKVDVIAKLPHPTTVKGVRSFLGHAGFYRRFIQDFSKIARPMTHLLEKETPFVFSKDCIDAFQTLKKKLTEAPILVVPDWNLPFELMCDASDFAIGAVLGQRKMKHFQPIHYASKTMTEA